MKKINFSTKAMQYFPFLWTTVHGGYIQCDSTIHLRMFITSSKETVQLET